MIHLPTNPPDRERAKVLIAEFIFMAMAVLGALVALAGCAGCFHIAR